jgi:hypothetical protein
MIRRDLLRLGSGVALGAALSGPLRASGLPSIALYDRRYSDARRFAAAAQEHGAVAFDTGGDVATLWYCRRLEARIDRGVAGLTSYADLLLIGDLLRSAGLRARFLVEHDARGGNLVRHSPAKGHAALCDVCAQPDWSAAVAAFAFGGVVDPVSDRISARAPDFPGTLWSWRFA